MSALVHGSAGVLDFCLPIARQLGVAIELRARQEMPRLNFEYLSVALTRSPHGQTVTYGAIHHAFHRDRSVASSRVESSIAMAIQSFALRKVSDEQISGSSLFRFSTDGEFISRELGLSSDAVWTLDFAYVSQFENEVRAAHNLPLGSPDRLADEFITIEYSAPIELDMQSPYLHLFAHDPRYKIRQLSSHTGFVSISGGVDLLGKAKHAVDYLEGVVNE